ncbi:MAG: sigma-70 family RNA polymerase sigma factor [candidate division Zixibacteria bacterium]|nr:sigma-70 family RNA polymerase sigma factor [candidate division Zixibacteria bacterium]
MKRSLSELWKGVLDKDPECWSELVHRLEPLVYAVARKYGLSDSESDDCAQETWLSLFRARHRIVSPKKIPGWLAKAVSRRAVRIAKTRDRDVGVDGAAEPAALSELPDEELERLETAALVRVAVDTLELRCRRLLHALYFAPEDKKYSDIARDLGLPPNSLGPTRSRCLKKLRAVLKEMGYERVLNSPEEDS